MADNIINWGLVSSYWAEITEGENGQDVYGVPKKFHGIRAINFTQSGDMVKVYADGTVIYTGKTNNGYEGTLEATNLDEDFMAYALGEIVDEKKVQIEPQEAKVRRFALLWEWEGDRQKARHCMFNVTANRPDLSATTKGDGGTKAAQYQTLNLVAVPRESDTVIKVRTRSDTLQPIYENWFNSVPAVHEEGTQSVTVNVKEDDTPVEGVKVMLSTGEQAGTNTAGVATFSKKAGTYAVFLSKDGYTPKADTITVENQAVSKDITIESV